MNGLLFKFFQKGIDRDDMFKVNVGLNFYYKHVFGEPLYNENGQVQTDTWLEELKNRTDPLHEREIEEQIERQLAWILTKDKTKAALDQLDRDNRKKGVISDNKDYIFDSEGKPILLRFGHSKSDAARLCSG